MADWSSQMCHLVWENNLGSSTHKTLECREVVAHTYLAFFHPFKVDVQNFVTFCKLFTHSNLSLLLAINVRCIYEGSCKTSDSISVELYGTFLRVSEVHRVRRKTSSLNKMLQHAQYITQSDNTYTALSNTDFGTVCKISMNCVSCVVIFFIF